MMSGFAVRCSAIVAFVVVCTVAAMVVNAKIPSGRPARGNSAAEANGVPHDGTDRPGRFLDDHTKDNTLAPTIIEDYDDDDDDGIDLSNYALQFQQCQFIRTYDDTLAWESTTTVMATQTFVVFRMGPADRFRGCPDNHDRYLVDIATYLDITVPFQQSLRDQTCRLCAERCPPKDALDRGEWGTGDERCRGCDGSVGGKVADDDHCGFCDELRIKHCRQCFRDCEIVQDPRVVDATEFATGDSCQLLYDPLGDDEDTLYAGPVCNHDGTGIEIGVFRDIDCNFRDESLDLADYLADGTTVSYELLEKVTRHDQCQPCHHAECHALYRGSARCEKFSADPFHEDVKRTQDERVCDFVESVMGGTYHEDGEIFLTGRNIDVDLDGGPPTLGQVAALVVLGAACLGLVAVATGLRTQLAQLHTPSGGTSNACYELVSVAETTDSHP